MSLRQLPATPLQPDRTPRGRRRACAHRVVLFATTVANCGPGDTHLDITFNPCEVVHVDPADDASDDERLSVADAIVMWNEVANTRLTDDTAANGERIPVLFDTAAPMFHGVYNDEAGEVIINRRIRDPRRRATTIAHELGHAFGLWHVDRKERVSVMNPGICEQVPTPEDAAAVWNVWGQCARAPTPTPASE